MASSETWEQNILRRHERSAVCGEKRVLKKEEQVWAASDHSHSSIVRSPRFAGDPGLSIRSALSCA